MVTKGEEATGDVVRDVEVEGGVGEGEAKVEFPTPRILAFSCCIIWTRTICIAPIIMNVWIH